MKRRQLDGKNFYQGQCVNEKYFWKYLTSPSSYFREKNKTLKDRVFFKEIWIDSFEDFLEYFVENKIRRKKYESRLFSDKSHDYSDPKFKEFNLDREYLLKIYPKNNKCPITKKAFIFGLRNENSPELDRIDGSKGYIKGNVAFVSKRMSTIKSNASKKEIMHLLKYMLDEEN